MKSLTKEEKRSTLDSFVIEDDRNLETLDRSTLEAWATCPWQAAAIEAGRVKTVGIAAEAGEVIHQALATVTRVWVEDGDTYDTSWTARDNLRTDLEFELRRARPDLQPEVLAGMMPSAWAWAKFLSGIRPGNVLAFDGGHECGRSSQLAYDFPDLGARVTSELDLLCANRDTTELIDWYDYKTGHATHDVDSVANAFQFQKHAMLILHHYQEVQAARLRVWDTRTNRQTYTVTFPRSRFHDYEWRVRSAVETRQQHRADPPCWPKIEGCRICPVAALCPVCDEPIKDGPEAQLKQLIATEARADALRKNLAAWVDANQQDIVCGSVAFGRQKPKTTRKSPATLYDLEKSDASDSDPK